MRKKRPDPALDARSGIWHDETQRIDSACVHEVSLANELARAVPTSPSFVRVVIFGRQWRGLELALDPAP